jgi:predicted DNA-binding WGR domain protein
MTRAVRLERIDPARNMRRFYALDIEADLFGGVLLMKQFGRIGVHGRVMAEHYDDETLAFAALQKQAERKRRRGYVPTEAVAAASSTGAQPCISYSSKTLSQTA